MRVAVSNLAWLVEDDEAAASVLRDAGISGVELALTRYFTDPVEAEVRDVVSIRSAWSARGLPIIALQSLLFARSNLRLFDADGGAAFVAYLRHFFDLAAVLGAERLVLGSPRNRRRGHLSLEEAFARARPIFERLGAAADQRGLCLCLEPNPQEYGCDFLTTAEQVAAFVRSVGSPGVGVHLDTACVALAGEGFDDAVSSAGAWLRHVHASEPGLAPLGTTGTVDHAASGQTLRHAGYDGWVSIEMLAREQSPTALRALEDVTVAAVNSYG